MLKHIYIVTLYLLFLLLPFTVDYFSAVPYWYFITCTILFILIETYGAAIISSGFHIKALCSAKTTEKQIALTFDDGPSEETSAILDTLKDYNARATFFCIGKHIAGREHLLKRMHQEGHLIGNHSYEHGFFFDLKSSIAIQEELKKTSQLIEAVIGGKPQFFRPPYGVTTPAIAKAVKKLQYKVIGWSIRSLDTSIKDKKQVMHRIQRKLKPGAILLLHDSIPEHAAFLKELLHYLNQEHYTIVSLDTLLKEKAYA